MHHRFRLLTVCFLNNNLQKCFCLPNKHILLRNIRICLCWVIHNMLGMESCVLCLLPNNVNKLQLLNKIVLINYRLLAEILLKYIIYKQLI